MDEQSRTHEFESPVELKFILKESSSSLQELMNPVEPPNARPLPSQEEDDMVGPTRAIRKKEFVKVILEALYALGYWKSAAALRKESGISLNSTPENHFWNQLFDRKWDDGVAALHNMNVLDENTLKAASLLIYEHKFFQLVKSDNRPDALNTLTEQIFPFVIGKNRESELVRCIVSPAQRAITIPKAPLIVELEKILPPTFQATGRRLERLVEQAIYLQKAACYFHNSWDRLPLYTDHQCERNQVPSETMQILLGHHDEVWFLKFSNNGEYLASSSKDKSAIVWKVHEDGKFSIQHILTGHTSPVCMISWSRDDRQLLTCGFEEAIKRWKVSTGVHLDKYTVDGGFISCEWTPSGKHFLSCSTNKIITLWGITTEAVELWRTELLTTRTMDVGVATKNRGFICSETNNSLGLVKQSCEFEKLIECKNVDINSFSLSGDTELVLLHLDNNEICLWRIVGSIRLLMRFKGHKSSSFLVRSCLGGYKDFFVASGSEDSKVYIWHAATGELIHKLSGHLDVVNCVSWNPRNPHMFASASDDKTIRIWGLKTNTDPKLRDNLPSSKRKRS